MKNEDLELMAMSWQNTLSFVLDLLEKNKKLEAENVKLREQAAKREQYYFNCAKLNYT